MRVIAGSRKGLKLQAVPGDGTRPILDRVKTALFDTIGPNLEDGVILDMFAGTGQLGIEALSRGASLCIFCDTSSKAIATIKENLQTTNFIEQSQVRHTDCFTYLKSTSKSFRCVFVAPPQYKGIWIEAMRTIAERPHLVDDDGFIAVQIDPKEYEELQLSTFREAKEKRYGNTLLVFYEKER